jgi:hypothetical protein
MGTGTQFQGNSNPGRPRLKCEPPSTTCLGTFAVVDTSGTQIFVDASQDKENRGPAARLLVIKRISDKIAIRTKLSSTTLWFWKEFITRAKCHGCLSLRSSVA